MEDVKICSKCNINKSLSEFYFRKDNNKYRNECKECLRPLHKLYREKYEQTEKAKKTREQYNNSDRAKELARKRSQKYENSQKCKEYRKKYYSSEKGKQNTCQRMKKYRSNPQNKAKINEYVKNRRVEDEIYYLKDNIRRRINEYLKKSNLNKCKSSIDIIGCSWEELKQHLENQFKDNMSWDNKGKWHIDHIIPLASAKSLEDVYKLNHYTNLQPLWADENLKKSDKLLF